jgi:hypothetical protein
MIVARRHDALETLLPTDWIELVHCVDWTVMIDTVPRDLARDDAQELLRLCGALEPHARHVQRVALGADSCVTVIKWKAQP